MSPDSVFSRPVGEVASVLDSDVDLLEAVAPEHRDRALHASRTRVLHVGRGEWDARRDAQEVRGGHGLLVLSGVLVRRVGITDHIGAELLGPGDLLRPLEHDGEQATLPFEATWNVLEALRLAILDHRWSLRMCQYPDVGIALTARAMRRSRRLANTLVIASHPRLDERCGCSSGSWPTAMAGCTQTACICGCRSLTRCSRNWPPRAARRSRPRSGG
jgi:hypothetical protein